MSRKIILFLCGIKTVLNFKFPILNLLNVSNVLKAELTHSIFIAFSYPIIMNMNLRILLRIFEAQLKGKVKNTKPRTKTTLFL